MPSPITSRWALVWVVSAFVCVRTLGADASSRLVAPALTNAIQVRQLSSEAARRQWPVRLRGVVTYVDAPWNMMFVQDATAGVFVQTSAGATNLATGQEVEITGVTHPGAFSPIIEQARVQSVGTADLPRAKALRLPALADGHADGYRIEVRGLVGSAVVEENHLVLQLEQDLRWLRVVVRDIPADWPKLVNARLRLRGVCAVSADSNRRVHRLQLFVPDGSHIVVEQAAPNDPFARPIQSIAAVLSAAVSGPKTPFRVQAVLETNAAGSVLLRDASGALPFVRVNLKSAKTGLLMDVVGSLVQEEGQTALREIAYRRLGVLASNEISTLTTNVSDARAATNLITSIEQVRALTPAEAGRGLPVRIRCVVTYYDRFGSTFFVQDAKAGIFVAPPETGLTLKPGDWIELAGVTAPGDYVPIVTEPRFQPLGRAPLPEAREFTLGTLSSGAQDSQWIAMRGVVQAVKVESGRAVLDVAEAGGRFEVLVPNVSRQAAPTNLVDARVRLEGVCGTVFNQKRQLMGVRLFVPNLSFVSVEQTAAPDPAAAPVRSIGSLLQFTGADLPDHRVRIRGLVTLHRPAQFLFLQDNTAGILIRTDTAEAFQPGDEVEALGFPTTGRYTPVLDHATLRKIRAGPEPAPVPVSARQALSANFDENVFDARLVRLRGRLLDLTTRSKEKLLVLQDGASIFNAYLDTTNQLASALRVGSVLDVTGVCSVQVDGSRHPTSFQLQLRTPADIRVVASAPWWTARHTAAALGGMGTVLLAVVSWVLALRRRVQAQTELIKQRLEREQALEARYRELFESNPHPIWVYDRDTLAFLAVNEAAVHHYGYSRQEFLRMTAGEMGAAGACAESGERTQRGQHHKRNGEVIDVEVSSHDLVFAGRAAKLALVTDTTERLRAEAALRASEERFRTLSTAAPIGIFLADAEGLLLYTNPHLEGIMGLSSHEGRGENWQRALHPDDAARVVARWQQIVAQAGQFEGEFRFCRPDGQTRWVDVRTAPIRAGNGAATGHVGTVVDITPRKQAEADLQRAQKELLDLSRQAGMAEVATNVLHNVGNVLTSVNVSSTLLAERVRQSRVSVLPKLATLLSERATEPAFFTEDERGRQLPGYLQKLSEHLAQEQHWLLQEIDSLAKNIEHIKDIVSMQQAYAKLGGVTESVQISELAEHALHINASALVRHDVQVVRDYQAAPPVVVDKHKVLQVLVNLIRNAKYACDESGRHGKQLIVRVSHSDDRVRVLVADNGIGIPPENLTRIFNHGFTTRRQGHGFGLHSGALAAQEMGGALRAHSDGLGHGATFTLELPLAPPTRASAPHVSVAA